MHVGDRVRTDEGALRIVFTFGEGGRIVRAHCGPATKVRQAER
jgi:hypothetical protein